MSYTVIMISKYIFKKLKNKIANSKVTKGIKNKLRKQTCSVHLKKLKLKLKLLHYIFNFQLCFKKLGNCNVRYAFYNQFHLNWILKRSNNLKMFPQGKEGIYTFGTLTVTICTFKMSIANTSFTEHVFFCTVLNTEGAQRSLCCHTHLSNCTV